MGRPLLTTFFVLFLFSDSFGQVQKPTITRGSGGSIQTPLGYDIVLNKESTLTREWVTVHYSNLPADIMGTVGIATAYVSGRAGGDYRYNTKFTIETREPLSAIEIRFLLFDIWGAHIKTLSMSEVQDIEGTKELSGTWNAFSENEVSEYYASITYIARVRTKAGRVFEADPLPVIEEARKFSKKFTSEELEPKSRKPDN